MLLFVSVWTNSGDSSVAKLQRGSLRDDLLQYDGVAKVGRVKAVMWRLRGRCCVMPTFIYGSTITSSLFREHVVIRNRSAR